jgi:L,D-transpeptidase ErfK/SrfK
MLAPLKKTCIIASVLALLSLVAINSTATGARPLPHQLSGGESAYIVQRGDSLTLIGARFGISPRVLSALNMLNPKAPVKPGQQIRIDNRHVVPAVLLDGIVVNVPQRMLFVVHSGELVSAYPVAVGRTDPKWRTPASRFTVVRLDKNPVWLVPVSIQHEMAQEGEEVETRVKPGPENPLGRYRIKLSIPDYAIHDTIAPASIYSFRTHGCIRLFPSNAEAFFAQAKVGMIGETIYEPVLLARLPDGRIFLEVNRDVYKRAPDPLGALRSLAQSFNLGKIIDWREAGAVVQHHEGIAREITVHRALP